MGDRISVSFKNGKDESVALFSHWGGISFYNAGRDYVRKLKQTLKKRSKNYGDPIGRLEPDTVMVDFIREVTKNMALVEHDLYLGKDSNAGDNSDNGHHVIDLKEEAKDIGYKISES
jgi:hypothetical protein